MLGIGVSNRPLIRMLLEYGAEVTACDKTPREKLDEEVLALSVWARGCMWARTIWRGWRRTLCSARRECVRICRRSGG